MVSVLWILTNVLLPVCIVMVLSVGLCSVLFHPGAMGLPVFSAVG